MDTALFSLPPKPSGKGRKCLKKPHIMPQLIFTRRRSLVRVQQSPPPKVPDFARNQGLLVLFREKSCYAVFSFSIDHMEYHSWVFPVTTSLCACSPIFAYSVADFEGVRAWKFEKVAVPARAKRRRVRLSAEGTRTVRDAAAFTVKMPRVPSCM